MNSAVRPGGRLGRGIWLAALAFMLGLPTCVTVSEREPVAPILVEDDPEEEKDYKILRSEYEEVLKGGLQKVMRWYYVKPHYKGEVFAGYEVAEIYLTRLQKGPLKVGDVVVTINDLPVERPEHAMAIWRGLWNKKSLKLKLSRKGKKITYQIPIVNDETAPESNP